MKRKLEDFGALSPAETKLIAEIGLGETVVFGDAVPPKDAGPERTIRAELVRYLMLGDHDALEQPVPETGVRVVGARITGVLNLEGADCPLDLALIACLLEEEVNLFSARLGGLYLDGSEFPGLYAQSLEVRGGVFLRHTRVTSAIQLMDAQVNGALDCDFAVVAMGQGGESIYADRLNARGGVYLRQAKVTGTVRLLGARIGGNLDCDGAKMAAGADGKALDCDGAEITGALFLRQDTRIDGVLDLSEATIGSICDERGSWPKPGNLVLDRCRYGAFTGHDITAQARLDWLGLQDPKKFGKDFQPQPWEHCAKVLREMGHGAAARDILIDKERRQRAARRDKANRWQRPFMRASDEFYWATTCYGRKPLLAVVWLFGLWLLGCGLYFMAAQQNAIKPNNAFVLRAPEWVACAPDYIAPKGGPALRWRGSRDNKSQLACFYDQPEAASYPKFSAFIYSADTLLPIVAMEMQEYWIPDEDHWWGARARWFLWVQIIMGWALTLLAVAGFSGLIKTDNSST